MTQLPHPAGQGYLSRLGVRLVLTFGLVLLPLAILSFVQTRQYEQESNARAEAALLGATVQVAAPQTDRIMRARGTAAALASAVAEVAGDLPRCRAILKDVVARSGGDYTFAAFIPADGRALCSSLDRPMDFSGNPRLTALLDDPKPYVNVNRRGPASGKSVLIFSHPVYSATGAVLGFLSLSVPHDALDAVTSSDPGRRVVPDALLTFDAEGEVLTATSGLDDAPRYLPKDRPLESFVGGPGQSFTGMSDGGRAQVFAVVPLVGNSLYVLANWPVSPPDRGIISADLPSFVFPLLMWAASLLVALLVAENQVLQHIRALRDTITGFADGNRVLPRLDFEGAPEELRDVGEAYERMTESVIHDEAELEDMVHQKEVLLREVHHRVKNNLQLISSIINMQIRKAQSAEAKSLMKGLQDRVMSLATIHRELYQTTGLTDIRADELLQSIVRQIVKMAAPPGRPFEVEARFDDIRLTPDQAVPLSLLVTEALANAMKYSVAPVGELPMLCVELTRGEDGMASMHVLNSAAAEAGASESGGGTGLGDQLIRAFVQQLGGTLERGVADGHYRLSVNFPLSPLSDGEERASGRDA